MTDTKHMIDLFTRFRKAIGGDVQAASLLTLAHVMQERQDAEAERPKAPPAGRMLSLKEAAAYLGYTPKGFHEIVQRSRASHQGKYTEGPTIRFFQTGWHGRIQFKREWLDEFVAQHQFAPADAQRASCRGTKGAGRTPHVMSEASRRLYAD